MTRRLQPATAPAALHVAVVLRVPAAALCPSCAGAVSTGDCAREPACRGGEKEVGDVAEDNIFHI